MARTGTTRVTDALRALVGEFGDGVSNDPGRLRALLNDVLGSEARAHRLEIDALVRAAGGERPADGADGELDAWAQDAWASALAPAATVAALAGTQGATGVVDRTVLPGTVPAPLEAPPPPPPEELLPPPPPVGNANAPITAVDVIDLTDQDAPPPPPPSGPYVVPPEEQRRRRPALLVVPAIIVVLLLAAGAAFAATRGGSDDPLVVPTLTGLDEPTARAELTELGVADSQITVVREAATQEQVGEVLAQTPKADAAFDDSTEFTLTIGTIGSEKVAKVIGLSQAKATERLKEQGFEVEVVAKRNSSKVDKGDVINQDPAAGKTLDVGSTVKLAVSLGPAKVAVPDVGSMLQPEAVEALKNAGFKVSQKATAQTPFSPKAGTVERVDPAVGTKLAKGSVVTLFISPGPPAGIDPGGSDPDPGGSDPDPGGSDPDPGGGGGTTTTTTTTRPTTTTTTTRPDPGCYEDPSGIFICP